MRIYKRPLSKIIPYARNPRNNDAAVSSVAASIKEFGPQQPIVVDADGVIIVGHTRLKAAQQLGLESFPVMVADELTPSQVKAYRIADNRVGELAEWDTDLLKLEIDDLLEEGLDVEITGFDQDSIDELFADIDEEHGTEGLTDPDEVPDEQEREITRPGDLWLMGDHRLMCGDSTDKGTVKKLLDGHAPHLMVTDPPYGISVVPASGKIGGSVLAENKKYNPVIGDDEEFNPNDILSIGCRLNIIFGANYFSSKLKDNGAWIVWDKGRPEGTTFSDAELAWTDKKGISVTMYRCVWHGMIREGESGPRSHPTQKPIKLISNIILDNSSRSEILFEPFSGSGTTIIAAEQTGRKCYAIELSPAYVDVAVRRWQEFTGIDAVLDGDGRTFNEVASA